MICKALHIREEHLRHGMHTSCWRSVSKHRGIWVTDFPYSAHSLVHTYTCTHSQTETACPRAPSMQKQNLSNMDEKLRFRKTFIPNTNQHRDYYNHCDIIAKWQILCYIDIIRLSYYFVQYPYIMSPSIISIQLKVNTTEWTK